MHVKNYNSMLTLLLFEPFRYFCNAFVLQTRLSNIKQNFSTILHIRFNNVTILSKKKTGDVIFGIFM